MRTAFITLSTGDIAAPLRTALGNNIGSVLYKPAYSKSAGIFCAKIVSVFPENASKGLPVCPAVILVNDENTGMPIAIVEAGYLTSLRTGAATGLATDLFADQKATIAALFGTGGQSRHQLEAMLAVRPFEKIFIFSRTPSNAERFCEQNQELAGFCELIPNPSRDKLKQCQVITTATTSPTPLFSTDEIAPNCHINAIGSFGKENAEISADTLLNSRIIVDQRAACLAEAGEICLMRDAGLLPTNFHPEEIGEVLQNHNYDNINKSRRTVFKSVGNAVQDLVCVAEMLKTVNQSPCSNISL